MDVLLKIFPSGGPLGPVFYFPAKIPRGVLAISAGRSRVWSGDDQRIEWFTFPGLIHFLMIFSDDYLLCAMKSPVWKAHPRMVCKATLSTSFFSELTFASAPERPFPIRKQGRLFRSGSSRNNGPIWFLAPTQARLIFDPLFFS